MKQTEMLKKNYEYKKVISKVRFYLGKQLQIVFLKNSMNKKLLGIAVSTKAGKAYQRNRAKRLIREAYKNLESQVKNDYSIVILIKKEINLKDLRYRDIIGEMQDIFKRAQILKEDEKL